MKRKSFFIAIAFLMIVMIAIGYFIDNKIENPKIDNLTGELASLSMNPGSDIRTIAICNESNFCQDYKITCSGGELIEKVPIQDATVQHPQDWIDPRNIDYDRLCK
jgi:hypothetical protein